MLVLDDENPGVWVLASDGKTLVTACAGDPCVAPRRPATTTSSA